MHISIRLNSAQSCTKCIAKAWVETRMETWMGKIWDGAFLSGYDRVT
jgi:hypothetical protein